ncbi:MAG: nicotinate-nucleotide adenylyltransferase [Dehalococcoidia bacterium]
MTTAILGGTFDPPHFGHLFLAECARHQFGLARVLFMPAGDPYRKEGRSVSAAAHRLEMTRLAIHGNPAFVLDDRECRREGPTYTVDTLEELAAEGHRDLLLLLGADAIADMPNWKDAPRIAVLARIAVALKDVTEDELERLSREAGLPHTPTIVDMPPLAISSTLIRDRAGRGLPIRYLVPDPVARYIATHALYRG